MFFPEGHLFSPWGSFLECIIASHFYCEICWILSNAYFVYSDCHVIFVPHSADMVSVIIDLNIMNCHYIRDMNPTWSWILISLMCYCRIWFTNILLSFFLTYAHEKLLCGFISRFYSIPLFCASVSSPILCYFHYYNFETFWSHSVPCFLLCFFPKTRQLILFCVCTCASIYS